ncbi:hypothetical protein FRC06_001472 [Ceratobasidium sp. 370]|nr:hypothetical protein FRC06_001472 [Ceratobasidium sp. 370]
MPLPAVAFVLTMMQDCIQEWETGRFQARENNFRLQQDMFDAHLHGLNETHAGVWLDEDPADEEFCQSVTRACDVRPDTDTEPEYDLDGRLTARSKGKGKAQPLVDGSDY